MAKNGHEHSGSHLFVGLAGETASGKPINSGLYRVHHGAGSWNLAVSGLPQAPEVRAIVSHPSRHRTIYAGTQDGPYVSEDCGDSWKRVPGVESGSACLVNPVRPSGPHDNVYGRRRRSGTCQRRRGGNLDLSFYGNAIPEIMMRPGANPAKRLLMMEASPFDQEILYGAIEVGGVMRTRDGGKSWENLSHGMYQNDQPVDTHGVLASSVSPGLVFSITGAGLFRSRDEGDHWGHVPLPPLDVTGRLYTRAIQESPEDPNVIWVGAGNGFDGNRGGLFKSEDGGEIWASVDMGIEPPSSIFCIAFDRSNPDLMACAAYQGQVYVSETLVCHGKNTLCRKGRRKSTRWPGPSPEGRTRSHLLTG